MSDAGLKLPPSARPGDSGIREWIRNAATVWNTRLDAISSLAGDAQSAADAAALLGVDALEQVPATGDLRMVAGSSYGSEWLLCDGSDVSRDTYSALFAKIGTTYGAASPETFTLPTIKAFLLENSEGFSLDTMEKSTWNIIIRV